MFHLEIHNLQVNQEHPWKNFSNDFRSHILSKENSKASNNSEAMKQDQKVSEFIIGDAIIYYTFCLFEVYSKSPNKTEAMKLYQNQQCLKMKM
jgi:hypothetical protein